MAKKIIMFVSLLRRNTETKDYTCPDGSQFPGTQTNEAPCKYFLTKYEGISQVLGIVTPEAKGAWGYLGNCLGCFCEEHQLSAPELIAVPFHAEANFAAEVLPVILRHINPNDEILLETTGGLRNEIMYLLLLSRILSYTGVPIVDALYSNFNNTEITSVARLFTMFDLSEGMQNLSAFGNVQTLRAYYRNRPTDENVEKLLSAMEQLTEAITLCRTKQIDRCMDQLNTALVRLDQDQQIDPLLRQLLPVFRSKFGKDGKMTTPTLIRWCVENGMLQQALTVYTEQMPAYLMNPEQGGFFLLDEAVAAPPDPPQKAYESKELAYFLHGLLSLPNRTLQTGAGLCSGLKEYIKQHGSEIQQAVDWGRLPRNIPKELEPAIHQVVVLVRAAAPHIKSGRWQGFRSHKELAGFSSDFLAHIEKERYRSTVKMINAFQVLPNAWMAELLKQDPANLGKGKNTYLEMIRNPMPYLPGSGYTITCPLEQAQALIADYVYIKFLRNMTNHANNESQESQREVLDYLKTIGYQDIDNISAEGLRQALLRALEHLEQAEEVRVLVPKP